MKTKKELKQDYKLYKSKKGVFQIKNKINGKVLIGSSTDLNAIWNRQRAQLNFGSHPNKELQSDWKKYGQDNFEYEIISVLKEKENEDKDYSMDVKELEVLFVEEMQPFDEKGYNKRKS
jgi:hypothetical protein